MQKMKEINMKYNVNERKKSLRYKEYCKMANNLNKEKNRLGNRTIIVCMVIDTKKIHLNHVS